MARPIQAVLSDELELMQFGHAMCQLRLQRGMTLAEVAKLVGVTKQAVSQWEQGVVSPTLRNAFAWVRALDAMWPLPQRPGTLGQWDQ